MVNDAGTIDHTLITKEDWDLIKDRAVSDAKIIKVWVKDENGDIHVELAYEGTKRR